MLVILPQLPVALLLNARLCRQSHEIDTRARTAAEVDKEMASALWQAETDRLNGIAAKAAGVLAADALVAAGIATQKPAGVLEVALTVACLTYLVSASVAACAVQMPAPRQAVVPGDVLDGTAERRMLEVVAANAPLGIRLQNLVSVGVRDTLVSLLLLIAVLALETLT